MNVKFDRSERTNRNNLALWIPVLRRPHSTTSSTVGKAVHHGRRQRERDKTPATSMLV